MCAGALLKEDLGLPFPGRKERLSVCVRERQRQRERDREREQERDRERAREGGREFEWREMGIQKVAES